MINNLCVISTWRANNSVVLPLHKDPATLSCATRTTEGGGTGDKTAIRDGRNKELDKDIENRTAREEQ